MPVAVERHGDTEVARKADYRMGQLLLLLLLGLTRAPAETVYPGIDRGEMMGYRGCLHSETSS